MRQGQQSPVQQDVEASAGEGYFVAKLIVGIALLLAVLLVAAAVMWRGTGGTAAPTTPKPVPNTAAAPVVMSAPAGGCPSPFRRFGQEAEVTAGDRVLPIELAAAGYALDLAASPARISRAGQLTGTIPAGSHVWLLSLARADTVDSTPERNPGTGRAYPIGEITTTDGCWSLPPRAVGYAEALGIDYDQLVLLVDGSTAAELTEELRTQQRGYTREELGLLRADIVATFPVETQPIGTAQ